LRRLAAQTLEDAAAAQTEIRQLIRKGLGSEAFNLSKAASALRDEARRLQDDADARELHAVALTETQGRLIVDLVGAVFDDVALPRPEGLLRARLQGWPEEPDSGVVEQAHDDVRRVIRAEVRAELLAEVEAARQAQRALPVGADEDAPVAEDAVVDAEVVEADESEVEDEDQIRWTERVTLPDGSIAESHPIVTRVVTPPREGPSQGISRYGRFSHPGLR